MGLIQWEESLLKKEIKDKEVGVIDENKIETKPSGKRVYRKGNPKMQK